MKCVPNRSLKSSTKKDFRRGDKQKRGEVVRCFLEAPTVPLCSLKTPDLSQFNGLTFYLPDFTELSFDYGDEERIFDTDGEYEIL